MKHYFLLLFLLLGAAGATPLFAQSSSKPSMDSAQIAEYRANFALDYSMPDYSIKKIDAKVIGPRLATILFNLDENYCQGSNTTFLDILLKSQIEGLSYAQIKKMKLDELTVSIQPLFRRSQN